ncbi:MAG: hypothetical protein L0H79_04555 [Intrasporangium sp.]|uniref:hypothetical protein n=1 Tax=Intrasporangium sp. TaxID=1925024 RepID=UPI002648EBA4|nr:hypothetical protein [Intrasporangium sp.]MDN5795004.1 hypothetical protein [Intrasporangium sp.]
MIEVDLDQVLGGDERAVTAYVGAWFAARSRLLDHVAHECPGLELPPLTAETLDWEAMQAPFSFWVHLYRDRDGLALDLIARLRSILGHSLSPLRATQSPEEAEAGIAVDAQSARRFYRQVVSALQGQESMAARIAESFGLNKAELGRLFGVSRQAASDWLQDDIPSDRRAKASVVVSIADLLAHRLKPGRLPGVARRPAAVYGGLSMLDLITADRHEELLASVRASFDFAQIA